MEKEPGELSPRQKLLRELIRLRDEYSGEIPDRMVDSTTDQGYKVRKGWFNQVTGNLELGMEQGLVTGELAEKAEQFADKYCTGDFAKRLTTREDIDEADALLNDAIAELEEES